MQGDKNAFDATARGCLTFSNHTAQFELYPMNTPKALSFEEWGEPLTLKRYGRELVVF